MPYYKAPNNSIHFLDNDSFAHLLPTGSVRTSDVEAEAVRPKPTQDDVIKSQIVALEAQITPRRLREAILGDSSFIITIDVQIRALHAQLGSL